MSDKVKSIYAPCTARLVETRGGQFMKVSFVADKMIEFIAQNKNDAGYINLNISERKAIGKYGETHSVKLDIWQPKRVEVGRSDELKAKANGYQSEPEQWDVTEEIPF